jgi:hypothetical protein
LGDDGEVVVAGEVLAEVEPEGAVEPKEMECRVSNTASRGCLQIVNVINDLDE